ncbi:Hypothetical_protein [Hexamita inflata]|uniref:Hypothetical_protein n=1 Tax=Hexamita inflata TaxID=28002 RepID=A0ABP1I8N3_9EUKA
MKNLIPIHMSSSTDDSSNDDSYIIPIIAGVIILIIIVFSVVQDCLQKMGGLEKGEEYKQLIPQEIKIQSVPAFKELCPDIPVTIVYAPELDADTCPFVPNYENNDLI